MAFLFRQNAYPSNGKRLTGFPRYTEVLERNFKKYLFTNLMTLLGFLPFGILALWAVLSSSLLVMLLAGVVGGLFAGPALSCMYDAIFRSLRDVTPKCWQDYKHAWKQNWKVSILPGILFCLLLGFDIFMAMLFWWSTSFPGWGTIAIYLLSILIVTMLFSIAWPQIVLFEQPFHQNIRNCFLFILRYFPKVFGCALLQVFYWAVLLLFFPWSLLLLPLIGFWFILYTANFLLYNTFNDCFQIEEHIAAAYPEQAPFYEDDETWMKRKEEEGKCEAFLSTPSSELPPNQR